MTLLRGPGGETSASVQLYDAGSSEVTVELTPELTHALGKLFTEHWPAGEQGFIRVKDGSPWLEVEADEGARFAIWRRTGEVYELDDHGAVKDEPLIPFFRRA